MAIDEGNEGDVNRVANLLPVCHVNSLSNCLLFVSQLGMNVYSAVGRHFDGLHSFTLTWNNAHIGTMHRRDSPTNSIMIPILLTISSVVVKTKEKTLYGENNYVARPLILILGDAVSEALI
jgi:hypothetical protein